MMAVMLIRAPLPPFTVQKQASLALLGA